MGHISYPATGASRRDFLKTTAAAAAGLTIGFHWAGPVRRAMAGAVADFAPNAFLRVAPDDTVTVIAKHVELGQGSYTGLATIVADELDADWAQIKVESAPADVSKYANTSMGVQGTGGSSAIANSWTQLRQAGASARAMLVSAAAAEWKVPAEEITVEKGVVHHAKSKREAKFGALADKAAKQPVPDKVALKQPADFKLIGRTDLPRVDAPAKSNGTAQFTIDVTMPGMLVAVLQRPPLFGGAVKSFDATAAKAIKDVVDVVQVPAGVAVVGKSFWAAKQGREALKITWDDTNAEKRSSPAIVAEYHALAEQPGKPARSDGDAATALKGAAKTITAAYEFPFLAHAPMEPLDAVVKLDAKGCEIWAGDQFQTIDQMNAAATAGLKPEQVQIHTLYAGGSFGRRANAASDYIVEAVSIAKALGANGTPVKLQWTREDDIHGGRYRPLYVHKMEAGLDAQGKLVAWRHHIVGQSILGGTPFEPMLVKNGIDGSSVEGANDVAYAIPNISVELTTTKTGVPVLWWRVVGNSHTAYAVETFIDEVAFATGKDPLAYRSGLLAKEPRHKAVLELAAAKSGWGKPLPKGQGRGIAVAKAFGTYVAQVAEVTVAADGKVKVDRVVCAVDCGVAVNPDIIAAQMEGGIGFALGAVLHGAITLKDGQVEQSNFDGYQVLRIDEMPKVEVHIVPSAEVPTGVGEPGVAPTGPAVANAVFAATGKRVRILPMAPNGTIRAA